MKILHIDTGLEWRGGQRQALTLHQGLLERNIESFFACNKEGQLLRVCQKNEDGNCLGFKFSSEWSRQTYREIKNLIDQFKPDIIHCHDSHAAAIGGRFHRSHILFHTRRVSYPIKRLSRYFKYRNIDAHVCVSEDIRQYMSQYFDCTFTVHSCVDLNRFHKKTVKQVFQQTGSINLVYVGAFSTQKGLEVLIDGFAKLCGTHPEVILHLVGDGTLFESIKKRADSLGVINQVYFYGARRDVEDFYLQADYVLCPSTDGEGSSGVIKEGMAAGKTVIASDLTANKELIDHQVNGLLFKNYDSDSLRQTLEQAIGKEVVIDQQEISKKVALFDCQNTIEQYITLYRQFKQD